MAISRDGTAVIRPTPGSDRKGQPRSSSGSTSRTSPLAVGGGRKVAKVTRQPGRSAR